MKALLQDKQVNNLMSGIVGGLAVYTFANDVIRMIWTSLFDKESVGGWTFKGFLGDLVVFVVLWLVAALVRAQAE